MLGQSMLDSLLALLFPDRCAGCRHLGALLCSGCRAALVPYPERISRLPASLTDVRVAFVFDDRLRHIVHQFKYRRQRRLARPLGALLAAALADRPFSADAVMAIPLHRSRQAERGFNQAEALAVEVARVMNIPLINDGLTRIRITEQQARLDARGRQNNMQGAFRWQRSAAPPQRVLLVDDILTTGATMSAGAEALRAAGAEAVYGLALARSRPDLA